MAAVTVQQIFEGALQCHKAGRLAEAEAGYRHILRQVPNHPDALHLLGVIAHQAGRHEASIQLIGQALALRPGWPEALSNRGEVLRVLGHLDAAISDHQQAIAFNPHLPDGHYNLAIVLKESGRLDEAIAAWRLAVSLRPDFPDAHNKLGNALRDNGELNEAIAACQHAIAFKPDFPEAWYHLGNALYDTGRLGRAIAAYRQAIVHKHDFPEAHNNLGSSLRDNGQLDEAIAAFRQAIALKSNFFQACNNLGSAMKDIGQPTLAIAALRQAIALQNDYRQAHSNLLLTLHYADDSDPESVFLEHQRWNRQYAQPLRQFVRPHSTDPDPDRKLRIGYVSPDFREHAVACHVLPLLRTHDRKSFEAFCYANVRLPDDVTARIRSAADRWRDIYRLSDDTVAELVRNDRIDILVDLAGHTADNRLLVFARKPAPIQVTRQGYPDTTGMAAIDYRMSDAFADPPGMTDPFTTEQLIRLPDTNWVYQPPVEMPPPDPANLDNGPIVFGSFNHMAKINEKTLRLWTRILKATHNSRLLLKDIGFGQRSVQQRVTRLFIDAGIAPDRLEFSGTRQPIQTHMTLLTRAWLALDPFPYHGTATTCDALWMGVPVITLAGQTHASRVGVSLLTNVGLAELVANNTDEYVRIATELAGDLPRLNAIRTTLRRRMQQSPLMDAARFARNMEVAYRQIWRSWCEERQRAVKMADTWPR